MAAAGFALAMGLTQTDPAVLRSNRVASPADAAAIAEPREAG